MSFFRREDEAGPTEEVPRPSPARNQPVERKPKVTHIAQGSKVQGRISGASEVLIEGRVEGEIKLDSRLVIGPQGEVHGEVTARTVRIAGKLNGNVEALERVELLATGSIEGDVTAPRVVIAEGGFCKGKIEMNPKQSVRSGAEPPDTGRIIRHVHVSWPLGFSGGFNGSMTGIENIRFVARIYGVDIDATINSVRDFAELGPSLGLPIKTYSSGMRARFAFGMSLAIDFDCYLIDEVIAVGDKNFQEKSKAAFKEKLPHARIILVSHSMGKIREYCDCGLLMMPDGIWYYDELEDLIAAYSERIEATRGQPW